MGLEKEKNIYQWGSILGFLLILIIGWKYINITKFAQQQSTDKVIFCKQNRKLRVENEVLKSTNNRLTNVIVKLGEVDNPNVLRN